jgi:hypothetical protein
VAYSKLPGYPFTGQDLERDERENLVAITQGERQKAREEEPWVEDEIDALHGTAGYYRPPGRRSSTR